MDNPERSAASLRVSNSEDSRRRRFRSVAMPVSEHEDIDVEYESILEATFDLTEERLRLVFSTLDTDSDGRIDYESLKRGLEEWQEQAGVQQISSLEGQAFSSFVSSLDPDVSNDIDYEEFAEGFRLVMLRALLPKSAGTAHDEGASMVILDYCPSRLELMRVGAGDITENSLISTTPVEEFYFNQRKPWVKTRWIDVITTGSPKRAIDLTMKRLAVKYLLHPLALEDALEIKTHRPKVDLFATHYYLILPIFTLVPLDEGESENYNKSKSPRCWFSENAICCKKKSAGSHTGDEFANEAPRNLRVSAEMLSIFVNVPTNNSIITCTAGSMFGNPTSETRNEYWQRVHRELEKPYSKLRQYDAQYLTYALLDQSVDMLAPITKAMKKEIAAERKFLRRTEYRDLSTIHDISKNLQKVAQTIKPFERVLNHVIEDDAICPGVTFYLRDVKDNLECAEDDLRQLIEQCQALDVDADKFQDLQMNRTLYLLTVISAIFLPAQFLTGLWGMNFIDMPELSSPWGYEMFWVITGVMTTTLLVLFCCFGRLRILK